MIFIKQESFHIKYKLDARDHIGGFGFITCTDNVNENELTWTLNKSMLSAEFIDLMEQYTPFISEYMEWQRNTG
jgi:hypothetical protein